MNEKEFVGKYGLFSTIVVTVIGVGVFSYPNSMANEVGTDGWLVTLAAGALCFIPLFTVYKIVNKNGYITFYNILENTVGKILSKVLALILTAYFIFSVSLGMRIFAEVIKMYLLEQTPTEFILLVMIFTGIYLVRGEISALVKFNEISFVIMFVPIIIVLLFSTRGGDVTNVLPVLQHSPNEYFNALITSTYSFGGFEIAFLILPHVKDKKVIKKALIDSMIFITIFYAAVVILCLMFFTKEHLKVLLWPTIALIRAIVIPGSFVERWEGIVMALWVLFYFTTFVNIYYFSGDLVKNVFKLHDVKLSSLVLAPIIYITALYPQNIVEVYDLSKKSTPFFITFSFIFVPFILLILKGNRKKEGGK
jgi:spore germination protein